MFQHVPRHVFVGYLPEVLRVLRPGGSFVFQLPTALIEPPPDPPDDNTFDLRFWREEDVRAALEGAGFTYGSCRRFQISEDSPVEYLRVHASRE